VSIPRYKVSNDLTLADFDTIEAVLRTSYWAADRPREVIEATFRSPASIPFFVLDMSGVAAGNPPATVGFARVVTDRLTIGWLCDVMIHPDRRGDGLGKLLVGSILNHPDLYKPGVRLMLGTNDAHGLYEQFGFFRRELMWRHPMGAAVGKGF
jgi:GNAT superfamily N-acetyltransferase